MRAELDRLEAVQLDDASRARVVALRTLAAPDRIAVAIAVLTAIGYLVIAALLYL